MSKRLRAAIIGCGSIYTMHADAIAANENAELVAVCDIEPERAQNASKKYGGVVYTDYKEMLKNPDIDVVHITTPHYLHPQMAIDAVNAGKDVLCEKPAAIHLEDAYKMQAAAANTGKTIAICFQNRFNTTSEIMHSLISSGEAGKVLGSNATVIWNRNADYYNSGAWRGKWETEGGGILVNQSIHTLDLQAWLTGMPKELKATSFTSILEDIIEVEDTATAVFRYEDSAMRGVFFATNCSIYDAPVQLDIICENMKMRLDSCLTITRNDGNIEISEDLTLSGEKSYWGCGHAMLINNLFDCLIAGDKFAIDIVEATKSIALIDAIYHSSKSGKFEMVKI